MLTVSSRAVNVLNKSGVELFEGKAAWQQLSNESFLASWDKLYEACPWATVFQSRAFIATWYNTYSETHIPFFIVNFEANKLTGLLFLAITKDGTLVAAGDSQAEYQVWLATDNNGNEFIIKALKVIDRYFPGKRVQLKYIPGNAPMQWLNESALFKRRCLVKIYRQPLLKIEEGHFIKELQKKNRREKLNRLKRIGALQFECITDFSLFDEIVDKLALQFDFRKRAVYNTAVFQEDPKRKAFLLSLFKQGLLHATVLKVNEEIIASNVSVTGKHWTHLQGINTHAPLFAKYSPGILHLLMLGKQLASEGISVFDLTPGDDPYKGQLATNYTEAYHLTVNRPYQYFSDKIKFRAAEQLKKLMLQVGLTPSKVKWGARKLKEKYKHIISQGLPFTIKYFISRVGASKKERLYFFKQDQSLPVNNDFIVNKNSLSDLLCFAPGGSFLNAWSFFEDAMRRFENGDISYTYCEEGRLKFCVWLSETKSAQNCKDLTLKGFYYYPNARDRTKEFLVATASLVIRDQMVSEIYALLNDSDKIICQAVKAAGFKIAGSGDRGNKAS